MRKHMAAEIGKSGQIWNTKSKMVQMGIPGELFLFLGHINKNRDCPDNLGRMVTLNRQIDGLKAIADTTLTQHCKVIII